MIAVPYFWEYYRYRSYKWNWGNRCWNEKDKKYCFRNKSWAKLI